MAPMYIFALIFHRMGVIGIAQAISIAAATPSQVATVSDIDIQDLQSFISRPLFLPARRPRPPSPPVSSVSEQATKAEPQAPEPVLILLGVVLAPHSREAIVRVDGGPPRSLREGQPVGPWLLRQVLEDRAVFTTPHGEVALAFSPHKLEMPDNALAVAPMKPPLLRRRP